MRIGKFFGALAEKKHGTSFSAQFEMHRAHEESDLNHMPLRPLLLFLTATIKSFSGK